MTQQSKEHYRPQPIPANGQFVCGGSHIAGFLGTTPGTITITDDSGDVLLNAMPVVAGFNRIPLFFNTIAGGVIQLGGGAAGTLLL